MVKLIPEFGIFACPNNAVFYVKHHANLIVDKHGGDSAFRLLIDLVLYLQNKHFAQSFIENALNN